MVKLDSVGEIIAVRELFLSGSKDKVTVIIGRPQRFPDSTDYYCPYQIGGLGESKVRYAGGIDTIQAFLLALQRVGVDLYTSKEAKAGMLKWEGSDKGNLGFPVPESVSDLVPSDD